MKFLVVVLFAILSIVSVQGAMGIPGGANTVDVNDAAIIAAVKFAISNSFPDTPNANYFVLSATKQVRFPNILWYIPRRR
jgi:hypothetical protein